MVALILLVAGALRLDGVGFGLPALNDPDEPLFMMTAFEMLRNHTLNPGWFGHPGTTTFYGLALICLAVGGAGILTGRFADVEGFASAVYADPGIVFLPARLLIVLCGLVCVWLTWRLGKRLGRRFWGGERTGLIAAALLAVNPLHIQYSQIIRTDVMASVFMLACLIAAAGILEEGKRRDYLLAGLFAGLACATKWPTAVVVVGPLFAGPCRGSGRGMLATGVTAAATLLVASPFLLLDYPAVLRDLAGEMRPIHPGATGGSFLENLDWYGAHPLLASLGAGGLAMAILGTGWIALRDRPAAIVVLPAGLAFLAVICAQSLRWDRWIVPLLPLIALAMAWAVCAIAQALRHRTGWQGRGIEPLLLLLLAMPMVQAARLDAAERAHDTRQLASAWVRRHAPPGSAILIEHAAIDLVQGPWQVRFPLGTAGCIDARRALSGRIRYSQVEGSRAGSPIVDIGHVATGRLGSCRLDYAILSHDQRYRAEPDRFAAELGRYRQVLAGMRLLAVISPRRGSRGGPTVSIWGRPGLPEQRARTTAGARYKAGR
jgi:hypothetical protein